MAKTSRKLVTLDPATEDFLRGLGGGKLSAGIHVAVKLAQTVSEKIKLHVPTSTATKKPLSKYEQMLHDVASPEMLAFQKDLADQGMNMSLEELMKHFGHPSVPMVFNRSPQAVAAHFATANPASHNPATHTATQPTQQPAPSSGLVTQAAPEISVAELLKDWNNEPDEGLPDGWVVDDYSDEETNKNNDPSLQN